MNLESDMQRATVSELQTFFTALSDGTRLKLLTLISDGEVSVQDLSTALGESQPKISRHLAYLRGAGLVSTRRDGKWIYYCIEQPMNAVLAELLSITVNSSAADLPQVEAINISGSDHHDRRRSAANINNIEEIEEAAPEPLDIFLL